jgi:hypothetical protein
MQKTTNDHKAHDWGPPVAGAGSSEICKACGAKRVVAGDVNPCEGRHHDAVAETVYDYDPYRDM